MAYRLCHCGRRIKSTIHDTCSVCRAQVEHSNAKDFRHRAQTGRTYQTPPEILSRMEVYTRRAELGLPLFVVDEWDGKFHQRSSA